MLFEMLSEFEVVKGETIQLPSLNVVPFPSLFHIHLLSLVRVGQGLADSEEERRKVVEI